MSNSFTYYVLDNYLPLTSCTNQRGVFLGFEYELLKTGLDQLTNLNNSFSYNFKCVPETNLSVSEIFQKYLSSPNSAILGGFTINSARLNSGYLFSIPTYQDNLVALSYSSGANEFMLTSFIDLNSSITFFLSVIFVGLLFLLYEKNINSDYSQNLLSSLIQGFWHSYLLLFRITHKISSFPSKCLHLTMAFTSLFLALLLVSSIIISYKKNDFTQLIPPSTLANRKVYTLGIYSEIVSSYGMIINTGIYSDSSDISQVVEGLNIYFDYVISDASVLTNIAQNQCQYQISTVDFFQFNMGVVMSASNNNALLQTTNKAIALAKQNITNTYLLIENYFNNPNSNCNAQRNSYFENTETINDPIDYNTFLAIFIVFIIILVIAAIAKLFERKMRVFFKNKKAINKIIKKTTGIDSQILKKISIFFELLTNRWTIILKGFEEDQSNIMEKEKSCMYLVHEIYNKLYAFFNNHNNNSFEKNMNDSRIQQSFIKNTSLSSYLPKQKSKFVGVGSNVKKRDSIFEEYEVESFDENSEKDEKDRLKQD